MILDSVLVATGGYYALPISVVLFADAVWWRMRHPEVARTIWLAPLLVPPLIIIALGARWSPDGLSMWSSWHAWALLAVAAFQGVLVTLIYRRRGRWWPGVAVLLGFAIVWTLYTLFMVLVSPAMRCRQTRDSKTRHMGSVVRQGEARAIVKTATAQIEKPA